MKTVSRQVILRSRALADIDAAIDHYRLEAGADVALRFVDEVEHVFSVIALRPETGSPRWAHELNLVGLRSFRVRRFPWLVFYTELDTHIDVWRVLDARRDIAAWLSDIPDA